MSDDINGFIYVKIDNLSCDQKAIL